MKTRGFQTWFACIVSGVALASSGVAQEVPITLPVAPAAESAAPATVSQSRSGWLADVIKLVRAGIEEDVLLLFVESAGTFNLDSDTIIYLRDLGVSNAVITAMMRHDQDLTSGTNQSNPGGVPSTPPSVANLLRFLQDSRTASETSPASPPTAIKAAAAAPLLPPSPMPPFERAVSIVMDSGSPDIFEQLAASESEFQDHRDIATTAATTASARRAAASPAPVREPYPVQLTNTIVVLRACGRAPNLIVIVR